jgi:hypothetical protein
LMTSSPSGVVSCGVTCTSPRNFATDTYTYTCQLLSVQRVNELFSCTQVHVRPSYGW